MLQLDTRPWPSSAFHAERRVSEISLSALQNGVFSRSTRNATNSRTSSSMIENVSRSHDCFPASGGAGSISVREDLSGANPNEDPNNSSTHQKLRGIGDHGKNGESGEEEETVAGRRPAADSASLRGPAAAGGRDQFEFAISRTPPGASAKPPQLKANGSFITRNDNAGISSSSSSSGPVARGETSPLIKPTLPPIRLAHTFEERASSPFSPSSSPSSSLLPSASAVLEPQLPALRGRASSPAKDNTSTLTPTSTSTDAKGRQSSPLCSSASITGGSSTCRPASSPLALGFQQEGQSIPPIVSLPTDRIVSGGDGDVDKTSYTDHSLPPLSTTPIFRSYIDSHSTTKQRSLDEHQSDSGIYLTVNRPTPPSVLTDTNSSYQSPTSLGTPKADNLTPTAIQPSSLGEAQEISIPVRLRKNDLVQRSDIDNSVESTLVLAHRAVIAIKSQSLPRSKTIGPTFTIGQPGSHPFSVTRKSNDVVMESEGETDTESTTSTASSHRSRMMSWHKKQREVTPPLENPWEGIDDSPTAGPRPLAPSSPLQRPSQPNFYPLINQMGNNLHPDLAYKAHHEPIDSSENGEQRTDNGTEEASHDSEKDQSAANTNQTSANNGSQMISPIGKYGLGGSGGGGGEDPNKRARKASEHEEDNGFEIDDLSRAKRRKIGQSGRENITEPQTPVDQGAAAAVSILNLSKSPPPQPSGPPTVESITTLATIDTAPTYGEQTPTPLTMSAMSEARSDYHKSPIENTPTHNTLPPIQASVAFSPSRSPHSPRNQQPPLPGVDSLLTGAPSSEIKHHMDHQSGHPSHLPSGGRIVKPRVISHVSIDPTPSPRDYSDSYSRPITYVEPAQQYRSVTPKSQIPSNRSPIDVRNAPIAPAPPTFPMQPSTSPLMPYNQKSSYCPPRNTGRPEHRTTLPPLKTDWGTGFPQSEPNSARTPTSKTPKRGRNGTPKNGPDSANDSPSVPGGFKCTEPGCIAPPFSTQYLLNSHANVHSDDRPHFCPVAGCSRGEGGKGFKRKNEMIRHGLVHKSPGYVCPFCPDKEHRYPRPDNLQRHVKAHHKDKNGDDPLLREVLAVRPEGGQRGRRRRGGGVSI